MIVRLRERLGCGVIDTGTNKIVVIVIIWNVHSDWLLWTVRGMSYVKIVLKRFRIAAREAYSPFEGCFLSRRACEMGRINTGISETPKPGNV